jgi:hypothetical protein
MRDIVVDLGDVHSVACMGVHPPYIHMRLGSDHESTKPELWLWECWLDLRDYVASLKRAPEDRIHVVFNGDLGDSSWKHPTNELLTYDFCDAIDVAAETVDPWLKLADDWFITAGTEAHAGRSGELEAEIAARIGAVAMPSDPKKRVWDIARLDLQGVRLDFAHTGRIGGRGWTLSNALGGLYGDVLTFYCEEHLALPSVVAFSHVHRATDSGDMYDAVRVLTTPGWLLRAYHYNRSPYQRADIGGTVMVVEDGVLTLVKNRKYKAVSGQGGVEVWRPK